MLDLKGTIVDNHSSTDAPQLAYAGGAEEANSGCYYLGGRLYSPAMRRFACADPLSPFDEGGLNRYAYCGGDPIGRIDPSGGAWWDWLLAGAGLAAAVAGAVLSGGALIGAVAAAGSASAALVTSSGAAAAAVAVVDVVSVVAEIGAIASTAIDGGRAGMIFGWIALGTGVASAGAGWRAGKLGKLARRGDDVAMFAPTPSGAARHRPIATLPDIDELPRTGSGRGGRGPWSFTSSPVSIDASRFDVHLSPPDGSTVRLRSKLYRIAGDTNAIHYGSDAPTTVPDQRRMLKRIGDEHPMGDIFFYGARHGAATGSNWIEWGDELVRGGDLVSADMLQRQKGMVARMNATRLQGRAHFEVLSGAREAEIAFARPGAHFHAQCYGAIDQLLVRMFSYDPPTAIAVSLYFP
ncbi:MAG: RHS repeat-associated core domain-containing protein [Sphingobium sp.]